MSSPMIPRRKRNVLDVLETLKDEKQNEGRRSKVLVRVDFNVPMNNNGEITNDSRIRGALPTIRAILDAQQDVVLMSHMGRPKLVQKGPSDDPKVQEQRAQLTLQPVATKLAELIGEEVIFASDCLGEPATSAVEKVAAGDKPGIVLLENLRFYKQEEKNDDEFANALASLGDAYINDAFGTCHRAHASVSGIPNVIKNKNLCGVGTLVASEISFLDFTHEQSSDICAIIGGSKVSTKLPVIRGLLQQVDTLVLGGGLAFTFLKALGVNVGNSLVEDSMVDTAKELMETAKQQGKHLVIPVDAVCSRSFPSGPVSLEEDTVTFDVTPGSNGIDDGWMGLDVGPKTVQLLKERLTNIKKCVMNGPLGVFEIEPFDLGTRGLVDILVDQTQNAGCITVVGGGDSVAALEQFGKTNDVTYVSTGGGATLELLAGDILPGVAAISDYEE